MINITHKTLETLGIITYIVLALTLLAGLFGRRLYPKVWFKIHRVLALLTFIVATIHGLIAIFVF